LKAIPILKKNLMNFKVVIAGKDDGFLSNLKELIKILNIENDVIFTGYLPKMNNALWELYKDTDILVSPSYFESFGYVFIEGITFKIPIIFSSQNDIILEDGKSGIYTPYSDYKTLAKNILQSINNRNIVKYLTTNASNSIKDFPDWNSVLKKYYKIYRKLK